MLKNWTVHYRFANCGLIWVIIALVSACSWTEGVLSPVETPVPTAAPTLTPEPRFSEAVSPPIQTIPTPDLVRLVVWTTEAMGPVGQSAGARRLSAQIAAFEAAHVNVKVDVILKKPYGKGGMLDYLTTTQAAVPALLPDVAILDIRELETAVQRNLIQPLDGWIRPEVVQDLVAPARAAGRVNSIWYGLPFAADVYHLIYNTTRTAPPATWAALLDGTAQYLFPAGGVGPEVGGPQGVVSDAFIAQYFAVGGRLMDEGGRPTLDQAAVTAVLQFYADGIAAGVIPAKAIQYRSPEEIWEVYLAGQVDMADVSAHHFLEGHDNFRKSSFAALPTRDGQITSVFHAWSYVLVSQDPVRQELAWLLIEWLTNEERLREWNLAAYYLPTRLSVWSKYAEDPYLMFLVEVLQNAYVRPTGNGFDEVGRGLQRAVQGIFAGTLTPAEAAAQAVSSVP